MRIFALLSVTGLVAVSAFAADFDLRRFPTRFANAHAIVVSIDSDSVPDILILDGFEIRVHRSSENSSVHSLTLDRDTTAVDVVDLDGDGRSEILTVSGDRILRYALPGDTVDSEPQVLFERHTRLSDVQGRPFPYVLSVEREGRTVIALPQRDAIELWSIEGALVETISIAGASGDALSLQGTFNAWAVEPPVIGREGLEFGVRSDLLFLPAIQGTPSGLESHAFLSPIGSWARALDALHMSPMQWPRFPLTASDSATQVLYALAPPDTVIRILREQNGDSDEFYASPKRRYSGSLLLAKEGLADFNRDGYTDLLLWRSPLPGTSLGSMTRALSTGTWPVELMPHLYLPQSGLYKGRPQGRIEVQIPLKWYLSREFGSPIRNLTLKDFDGDSRTDVAFTPTERSFSLWLYADGFNKKADFSVTLDTNILKVARVIASDDTKGNAILLRGEDAYYLLRLPLRSAPDPTTAGSSLTESASFLRP
ncbi:MAG: VCBS repeat-containing protein [Candidatus Hydrogenedentes bacterium]|nr:VCBS repeat-containing protein [Candidatus Hydrogenedentota bacterium]